MYKINDYVVYKRDVCKIRDIKDSNYVLNPIDDQTLTITIPQSNNFIRKIII